jgi:hypothetical protein
MSVCLCRDDVRRHLNHILHFIWVDIQNFGIRKKDAPLFTDGEHAYPNIASMPECGKWHQIIFTMRFLEKDYHQSKNNSFYADSTNKKSRRKGPGQKI